MSRKKIAVIIIIIASGIITASGIYIITRPRTTIKTPIDAARMIPYLQDGDIILRLGNSVWSVMFRDYSLTDRRFSHLGIVRIRDGSTSVIQSMGYLSKKERGVEEVSLEKFIRGALAVGIFRVQSVDGAIISNTAAAYLDSPFDWDFDITKDSTIYCTELLYVALKAAASEHILPTVYAKQVDKNVIPLEAISNNPAIDEIVYFSQENTQGKAK